jgi:hypothetical protein
LMRSFSSAAGRRLVCRRKRPLVSRCVSRWHFRE